MINQRTPFRNSVYCLVLVLTIATKTDIVVPPCDNIHSYHRTPVTKNWCAPGRINYAPGLDIWTALLVLLLKTSTSAVSLIFNGVMHTLKEDIIPKQVSQYLLGKNEKLGIEGMTFCI